MHRLQTLSSHLTTTVRTCSTAASVVPVYPNRKVTILDGVEMAFIDHEVGSGPTVVALHGNPTNSFLWRKVFKVLGADRGIGRLLAPDLAGQGRSSKSQRGFTFHAHADYVASWFDTVLPEATHPKLVLVLHDWGSGLLFNWAAQNTHRVAALIHMESLVAPIESWNEFPEVGRKAFKNMRTPRVGEAMVLEKNFFLERLLLGDRVTKKPGDWTEEEKAAYLSMFPTPESRQQLLKWPREIPIATEPSPVVDAVRHYEGVMRTSTFPKLFVNAEPGFFSPLILEKTKSWNNHQVSKTVAGRHFIQEDSGEEIGEIILAFLKQQKLM